MNKKGEISNNLLAVLIVVAIVIGLIGIFIPRPKVIGKVTDTGTLQVTIQAKTAINFTRDTIDFGTGTVTEGYANCVIDTEGSKSAGCTGFNTVTQGFVIENIGNQNVTLQLATGKNATTLLGGTNPAYKYKVSEVETGSCAQGLTPTTYTDVNSTAPGTTICSKFLAADPTDTLEIDVQLTIPSDSYTGSLTDTFTATATAI